MKILSWNVNGIRAAQKKGFLEWLEKERPDILCVQETKAHPDQLDAFLLNPPGYHVYWNSAEKKGYSGVATFTKIEPLNVQAGFGLRRLELRVPLAPLAPASVPEPRALPGSGHPGFDNEGRVLTAEFSDFTLLNIYFPNGGRSEERLKYKLDFYEETVHFIRKLKAKGKPLIISGDYNTAHKPIDLARPAANADVSGFLPVERAWLDRWIEDGQVDIFREFNKGPEQYTWWDMKTFARKRNIGWRIDYHFVTRDLVPAVKNATIHSDVLGSDHCPVGLELR